MSADISRRNPENDFELIQRVGSGTYGDVYKAKNIKTGEFAGIKIIKLEPGDDFAIIQQEVIMMKDCKHSNIVAYYGSYLRRGMLWIAMEYCGGGSMQNIYHATGPLPEPAIAFVCKETLKGLSYLHRKGKMHRDIKGANILLTEDGDIKLADFGVSAQITATMCKRKSFIGTPYWMAPEVAAVERKGGYNQQCDIWAVGITAIEFAELQPPMFDLHPMRALFLMSKSGFKPPELRDRNKWSLQFQHFIKQTLTKNPKRRPSADKLSQHPFLLGDLSRRLTIDLLEKARNPTQTLDLTEEEDGPLQNVPRRIPSKKTARQDAATNSIELKVNNINLGKGKEDQFSTAEQILLDDDVSQKSLLECVEEELTQRGHRSSLYLEDGLSSSQEKPPQIRSPPALPPKPPRTSKLQADNGHTEAVINHMLKTPPQASNPSFLPGLSSAYNIVNENVTPPALPPRRLPQSSHSSGDLLHSQNGEVPERGGESPHPPAVPPRKKLNKDEPSHRQVSNGLPPTPQVHMGACFLKVFNGCPLHINCTASWVHPETRDQFILIGANEGLYTLNLNEIHESSMELVHARKCIWLHVIKDKLMSLSGKTPYLYRHDLMMLHARQTSRFSLPMDKIPEIFIPRRLQQTMRVPDTRGCTKCCVKMNPFSGCLFLCAALPSAVILMQWYEPSNKFLLLKTFEADHMLPQLQVFEMFSSPELEYPLLCYGVQKGHDRFLVKFDIVDLNEVEYTETSSWFTFEHPKSESVCLPVTNVIQFQKDTVLISYDKHVKIVNLNGRLKSSKKHRAELEFDHIVDSIVTLQDSVLAFHKHGMQGRNFRGNEVTQEICDKTRMFRLLGSDKVICLESRPTADPTTNSNLYVLAGHESTY